MSVRYQQNGDGKPNFEVNGKLLHSARSPVTEAERFIASLQFDSKPNQKTILCGLGAGYLIDAVIKIFQDKKEILSAFVFFEPSSFISDELRKRKFAAYDRAGLYEIPVIFDSSELRQFAPARIVFSPGYRNLFPDECSAVEREFKPTSSTSSSSVAGSSAAGPSTVDTATSAKFFRRWCYCFFHNLIQLPRMSFIQKSESQSNPDRIAIFCGAAPTLASDLAGMTDILTRHQKQPRPFIMAADTAAAPLLFMGIVPDLILSIDAGYATSYHLRAIRNIQHEATLSFLSWTGGYPGLSEFQDANASSIRHFRTTFPLDQLMGESPLFDQVPMIENESRNTAGLALSVAHLAGCASVYLAGVSFRSDENGDSHTRGTGYSEYAMLRSTRILPADGYRARGYDRKLTTKNQTAKEGLTSMSQRLGLPILNLADAPKDLIKRDFQPAELSFELIDCTVIRQFLLDNWSSIAFARLTQLGLAQKDALTWHKRLTDAQMRLSI